MRHFYEYVLSFYGPNGIYPLNATLGEVQDATIKHLKSGRFEFYGDTADREAVRDIIIKTRANRVNKMLPLSVEELTA